MKEEKKEYPYFVKDLTVSQCILAVLQEGEGKLVTKPIKKISTNLVKKISKTKKIWYKKHKKYEKVGEHTKLIVKYQIIRGTNGKKSTLYNAVDGNTLGIIGDKLTKKEFLVLYHLQCYSFKKQFVNIYKKYLEEIAHEK